MAPIDEAYTDTKDLYLEILWQAQRVEDQKLVTLIKERLSGRTETLRATESCGQILPFPVLASNTASISAIRGPSEEVTMWPRRPAFQGLSIFSAYCAVVLAFIFLQHF